MLVSVITPIYNRSQFVPRIFACLQAQENTDFEWILVDDGSTDNIGVVYDGLLSKASFPIQKIRKKNGGKHTALNIGICQAKGELTLILDSDDYLSENAIKTINDCWNKFKNNQQICGIGFLKSYENGVVIGDTFPIVGEQINNIEMRYHNRVLGDKCEVFRTELLKQYPFPEYPDEKFISECVVWNQLAEKYDMVYFNNSFYFCEYLEEGLSLNIRKHFYSSPKGMAEVSNGMTINLFPLRVQIISSMQYLAYSLMGHISLKETIRKCRNKTLLFLTCPLGCLLWIYKMLNNHES